MGLEVTTSIRRSMAFWHSSVQTNLALAFRRAVTGHTIFAKFGIKGHWYPRTPSRDLSSFKFQGVLDQS
jgi:hypothetical protein